MKCENAIELIIDSLLDEPSAAAAGRLDEHLASCAACRSEAAQLRRLWDDLARLDAPAASEGAAVRFGRRMRAARARRWAWGLQAAAAIVLLTVGGLIGRALSAGQPSGPAVLAMPESGAFLLLIRGDEPERRAPRAQLVEEYSGWARELAAEGRLIAAAELDEDGARWIGGSEGEAAAVGGFFLIRAADIDQAERIARESPHIGYGGTIEVRALAAH